MPVTGLFLLLAHGSDSAPTQDILNRLSTKYNPSLLPPWSLSHRLFRETPNALVTAQLAPSLNGMDKGKPTGPRFLQVLSLSHHAPHTYIAITSTHAPSQTRAGTPVSSNFSVETGSGEPATIVTIPAGPQSDEFIQLVISKFGPLWQQRPQQTITVGNGHAFDIGDFRVRVGEARQGGAGAGGLMARAALCEIEWVGDGNGEGENEWESAEGVIRGFWEALGVRGARECFWVPGLAGGQGSVRQWCEILRVRG